MTYTAEKILRVAKRLNNPRRNYLLVNPLQGKHLPTNPRDALDMMNALGVKVAEKFSSARLVIGFAETATAIGALVAKNLSEDCFYVQTTRENFPGKFVEFTEEHSHAPEQKLFAENFSEQINRTPEIVFVDDELSTGKTLLNIVRQLKREFSALAGKKICAASIINRLSDENLAALAAENISCVSLVRLNREFDAEKFIVTESQAVTPAKKDFSTLKINFATDLRLGTQIRKFIADCKRLGDFLLDELREPGGEILILGTEEFMLPAIVAGSRLAEKFHVVTHSTTRSPIGICSAENYPIQSGFRLRSFYDPTRTTFIYNLKHYDAAIIVTDAQNYSAGLQDLLSAVDADKIFLAEVNYVRNLST